MASDTASLLKLFLPDFILEYFEFKGVIVDDETFNIELEEINSPPSEWEGIKVLSKGFFSEIVIQDFPIRGHKVFLHIRRRRWLNTETSKVIYRNWTLVEKGTLMTGELAAFLKEINRYSPE
ncbi:transposase [Pedobacter sp. JCM 36344]|uniref:ISAon1 family transposase N-terminal region protein n=1 Tax=Pedobacter sp. JCM 36344 TaxID=3374280 RepID=UPI00397D0F08